MKIWTEMEQLSEAWFRARAGRPTASQFSRILTPTGKDSSQWEDFAIELIAECIRPEEIGWSGNRCTDRGLELEPEARRVFEEITGLKVREVGFVTRDDEIAGCSPDGLVLDADGGIVAGLEIRCPLAKNHASQVVAGGLPSAQAPQVHGGMAVTGLRQWYFMSYCPGFAPLIHLAKWDAYTEKMSDALDRFVTFYAERRRQWMPRLLGQSPPRTVAEALSERVIA